MPKPPGSGRPPGPSDDNGNRPGETEYSGRLVRLSRPLALVPEGWVQHTRALQVQEHREALREIEEQQHGIEERIAWFEERKQGAAPDVVARLQVRVDRELLRWAELDRQHVAHQEAIRSLEAQDAGGGPESADQAHR